MDKGWARLMFEQTFKNVDDGSPCRVRAQPDRRADTGWHLGRRSILEPPQIDHARALIEGRESPLAVAREISVGEFTFDCALKGSKRASHVARTIV